MLHMTNVSKWSRLDSVLFNFLKKSLDIPYLSLNEAVLATISSFFTPINSDISKMVLKYCMYSAEYENSALLHEAIPDCLNFHVESTVFHILLDCSPLKDIARKSKYYRCLGIEIRQSTLFHLVEITSQYNRIAQVLLIQNLASKHQQHVLWQRSCWVWRDLFYTFAISRCGSRYAPAITI